MSLVIATRMRPPLGPALAFALPASSGQRRVERLAVGALLADRPKTQPGHPSACLAISGRVRDQGTEEAALTIALVDSITGKGHGESHGYVKGE